MDEGPKRRRFWRSTIFITIVAGAGLLVTAAVAPCMVGARPTAQRNACINNLRQIDQAKEQCALEKHLPVGALAGATDIDHYMRNGCPRCPAGGAYNYGKIGETPRCTAKDHRL
jgi:hypothetical protein